MSGNHLEPVSHHLCPCVQRAVIALTGKGVERDRTYIDLGNKPDWFERVAAYRAALAQRPSVRSAAPAGYPQRLHAFLQRRGSHLSRLIAEAA